MLSDVTVSSACFSLSPASQHDSGGVDVGNGVGVVIVVRNPAPLFLVGFTLLFYPFRKEWPTHVVSLMLSLFH